MASLDNKIPLLVLVVCSLLTIHLIRKPVLGRRHPYGNYDSAVRDEIYLEGQMDSEDSQCDDNEEQEDQDIDPINPDKLVCGQGRYDKDRFRPSRSDSNRWILAGEPVRPGEHPYLVQVFTNDSMYPHCGGALIDSDIVLTAAHCTLELVKSESFVRLGKHETFAPHKGTQQRRILDFKTNLNYTGKEDSDYDLAVLRIQDTKYKLETSQDFGSINRICMPNNSTTLEGPLTVIGWGTVSIVVPPGATKPNFSDPSPVPLQFVVSDLRSVPDVRLCTTIEAGASSILLGDSGGPLIKWLNPNGPGPRQAELVGLVSYLIYQEGAIHLNCYVDVKKLRLWVNKIIRMIR